MDTPLSQSNVSLKLSEIQERCVQLMEEELTELHLEDPNLRLKTDGESYNPYDKG